MVSISILEELMIRLFEKIRVCVLLCACGKLLGKSLQLKKRQLLLTVAKFKFRIYLHKKFEEKSI